MWVQRAKECVAMLMIGDGMLAMIEPERHCLVWRAGPRFWQAMLDPFIEHPNVTRAVGAAELALGCWLAMSLRPDEPQATASRVGAKIKSAAREAMSAIR